MIRRIFKFLSGCFLLLPISAAADMIHWEFSSNENTPGYIADGFVLTGGFDYNLDTGSVFNITLQTTGRGCLACNDFQVGGTGAVYTLPDGRQGVEFFEDFYSTQLDRSYWLQIDSFDEGVMLDLATPGIYDNLGFEHSGWVRLDDPYDPDMFERVGCAGCISAVGTLVPAPEPETYALMLAGLGVLGWHAKRRQTIPKVPPAWN